MKLGKKVRILSEKFNRELIFNKKYLNAEKKVNTKEDFYCICKRVILIGSADKKRKTIILKCS